MAPPAHPGPATTQESAPVVLFFTDNGRGLGHVTRMLAVARQARGRFKPVFLTLSLGYQILRDLGVPAEFFPAYHQLGLTKPEWSPLLATRVAEMISLTRARAVVVDHVTPPRAFGDLRQSLSGVELIWSRRGLWQPGTNRGASDLASMFDQVVEPGDFANPIDVGGSTVQRAGIRSIEPVVLSESTESVPRKEARRELGLPGTGRALLLNLSAPDTASLVRLLERVRDVVRRAAGDESIHLFAPLHPLHDETLASVEGVTFAPVYPVARFFSAFDGAISTAGYNSFHELIASGLPVIFLAHAQTNVDDQERRARFAQLSGRGHWAASVDDPAFPDAVRRMLRPVEASIAKEIAGIVGEAHGAEQFADSIVEAIHRRGVEQLEVSAPSWSEQERREVSAKVLEDWGSDVLLIDARNHSSLQLAELVEETAARCGSGFRSSPVFVISDTSPRSLVDRGLPFESIMSLEGWAATGSKIPYEEYVAERLRAAAFRYGATHVAEPRPEQPLDSSIRKVDDLSIPLVADLYDEHQGRRVFYLSLPQRGTMAQRLSIDVPSQLYVPRLLEASGLSGYETSSIACWLAILGIERPGAAFDVGANVGPYAWLAAAMTNRRVVAFEPVPDLAAAIRSVAAKNDLDITVEEVAVGDRDGSAELYLSDQTDSSNSLLEGFRPSSRSIRVNLRSIDSYVGETGVIPHALKVDTETTEPEVLAGGRMTLQRHRPWLLVEVLAKRSEDRLKHAIEGLGYHWYRIGDAPPFARQVEIVGDPNHEFLNWLFAPTEPDDAFWTEVVAWQRALQSCAPG